MVLETVFLVVAIVLFLFAAFATNQPRFGLVPLGLAFFALAVLVAEQTLVVGLH